MSVRDWFEGIRAKVLALEEMENDVDELRSSVGPSGQKFDAIGRGGAGDSSAHMLRVIEASAELDRERLAVEDAIDHALYVLYGEDGRGGLAAAKGSVNADILCAYYLQGMSWDEVACALSDGERENPKQWCVMRARRSIDYMERTGIENLQRY